MMEKNAHRQPVASSSDTQSQRRKLNKRRPKNFVKQAVSIDHSNLDDDTDDDDDDDDEEEEIKISPSGSVLMASENPYNKSERIREANQALKKTWAPEVKTAGKVKFNEKTIMFDINLSDSDSEIDDADLAQQGGSYTVGMEEQLAAKLLIVSLLPSPQNSEDLVSEESETEEICFGNNCRFLDGTITYFNKIDYPACSEKEGEIEEEICYEIDQETKEEDNGDGENGPVAVVVKREVLREVSRHLSRTLSLSRDPDSEDSNSSGDEEEVALDEKDGNDDTENLEKETTGEISENEPITEKGTTEPLEDSNGNFEEGEEMFEESASNKGHFNPFKFKRMGSINKDSRLLSSCLSNLESKGFLGINRIRRPNSTVENSRVSKEGGRPLTAPSRRVCSPAWKPDQLPQYNGFRSEYGLSVEQLQERKRNKIERAKFLRVRRQQRSREEEQKRYENNLIFSSWLARKRREANEKVMACNKLARHFEIKTLPAPTIHLERTGALRRKELKPPAYYTIQEFFKHAKPKDQKTYKVYLGVTIE